MDLEQVTAEQLTQGYYYSKQKKCWVCLNCNASFNQGEIYKIENRFFDAEHAICQHIQVQHENHLVSMAISENKYNTLTDNQKQLMQLFLQGFSDKEIAKKLNVSASTVRHQKFMFREKAKQARYFLALTNGMKQENTKENSMMPIHNHATMVDERYIITEEERQHILETSFSSLTPLKLKTFSPKEKKKIVILTRIAEEFETGKNYTEKEINAILSAIFDDFVTLRRYLIEYGYMSRSKDGSSYHLN